MHVIMKSQTLLMYAKFAEYKHKNVSIFYHWMTGNVRVLNESITNKQRIETCCNKSQALLKCSKFIVL